MIRLQRLWFVTFLSFLVLFTLVACSSPTPEPVVVEESTWTPSPEPTDQPDPTNAPTPTEQPAIKPTPTPLAGSIVFFQNDQNGTLQLYLMKADGSQVSQLTQGAEDSIRPQLSPDGQHVAYECAKSRICVLDLDGGEITSITPDGSVSSSPGWSPDGSAIVFTYSIDHNASSDIYIHDDSGLTQLTNDPFGDEKPRWSPDGREILYISYERGGNGTNVFIKVLDIASGDITKIPLDEGLYTPFSMEWSPNGNNVVFSARAVGDNPPRDIYVMNADGIQIVRLTDNGSISDLWPTWSPDGSKILFASDRQQPGERVLELYVMDIDGSNVIKITDDGLSKANGNWRLVD